MSHFVLLLLENNPIFTIIVSSILLYLIYFLIYPRKPRIQLPPGPRPYPVIGNILDLKGKDLETFFSQCRQEYGDVFCLRIFSNILVVFNGYEVIKNAFVANSHVFSERPSVPLLLEFKAQGLVMANGARWKANRRFAIQTLRDFGMGKNIIQDKIHEEVQEVLREIENFDGKPFDIKGLFTCAITDIILSILCGKRYQYDDEEFCTHLERMNKIFAFQNLFVLPSVCKYIPGDPFGARKVLDIMHECTTYYVNIIDRHLESYDENITRDFIDVYIKEVRNGSKQDTETSIDKLELAAIVSDLFAAGSETTATALKWGVLFLVRDQELQNRLYGELTDNVPGNRFPVVQDKCKLPLLEATIFEILRVGNVVPLGVPHAALRDCKFKGFDIPKGSHIFPNMYSVMTNKDTWKEPNLFQPERFLSKEGVLCPNKELIPFSTGRRSCAGEELARMELFLFFSALVQRFEFLPPDGDAPPGLDAEVGVTRAPKPFMVRAIKRKEGHHQHL